MQAGALSCDTNSVPRRLSGWYTDPPSSYPDSDDDDSATITVYRYHDDDAEVYRDAWDPMNLRPTCLVAMVWNAEIRTIVKKVGMYTIRPIATDGEVYAPYGTEFPLAESIRIGIDSLKGNRPRLTVSQLRSYLFSGR